MSSSSSLSLPPQATRASADADALLLSRPAPTKVLAVGYEGRSKGALLGSRQEAEAEPHQQEEDDAKPWGELVKVRE